MSEVKDNELSFDKLSQEENELSVKKALLIRKGLYSDNPLEIIKAQKEAEKVWDDLNKKQNIRTKSYSFNPTGFIDTVGFRNNPSNVSNAMLRRMARTPIIKSIIETRVEQVASFAKPQNDEFQSGFAIRKKLPYYIDKRINQVKYTDEDFKEIQMLTEFVMNCGTSVNDWDGDNFGTFLRKITHDSLTLDQCCFETVRNLFGKPIRFEAVDAAHIRKAPDFNDPKYRENFSSDVDLPEKKYGYYPTHVWVDECEVKAEFYPWEMSFGIRNPSTDIHRNGYGRSELEDLIEIVTWQLYADQYNGKFFSQGSAPKGIITMKGQTNENRLAEFRQQWMAMVQGVQNSWKTPVMEGGDDFQYIDLHKSNNDMQFSNWQEYLIKIACAVYKMAPEEIGFDASGGSSKTTFESKNSQKLKYSRDKGLKPLLTFIQEQINKYLINPYTDKYEFAFVGVDADEDQELESDIKKMSNFMTINEAREKRNLPPIENGDIIANQFYMQKIQQEISMQQMEAESGVDTQDPEKEKEKGNVDRKGDGSIKNDEEARSKADDKQKQKKESKMRKSEDEEIEYEIWEEVNQILAK